MIYGRRRRRRTMEASRVVNGAMTMIVLGSLKGVAAKQTLLHLRSLIYEVMTP